MLRFRPPSPDAIPGDIADLFVVGQLIDGALRPGHFFVAPELRLTWIAAKGETIPWEIFRGRLLDAAQTRAQRPFLSWHVIQEVDGVLAAEPLISVKLDVHERQIHVTRGLHVYAWEGYDVGGGVIESREVTKWTRELVGTIILSEFADLEGVRDELICLIWQAIVGTSRLPLTSVEAPLPAFVLGQLHYLCQTEPGANAVTAVEDWLMRGLQVPCAWREMVKLVEFTLRQAAINLRMPRLVESMEAETVRRLMRTMFNDVSLSPYTNFVDNALALGMESGGTDFVSHLLRQLGRHLTAYDLVTFHHRGANYPDALLLDAALKILVLQLKTNAGTFLGSDLPARWHRRALRQACLLRRHYEGHLVPDAPTSPGENARVMLASHLRVSEEQLMQPHRRQRQLFADDPLVEKLSEHARFVLAASVRDLAHLDERVEMGLGLFIDRPLGYGKEVGEPDLTPMLAHEVFSPSLARRRWQVLKNLCAELAIPFDPALDDLFEKGPWPAGLPHTALAECPRPTAALCDVRKVASDFVVLRTLPRGLADCWRYFDWQPLRGQYAMRFLDGPDIQLYVQALDDTGAPVLAVYDARLRRRLEMTVDASQGYRRRARIELPRAGLRVMRVWEDTDDPEVLKRHEEPAAQARIILACTAGS